MAGIAIVQPIFHAGGITECEDRRRNWKPTTSVLAPHCPLGPLALAACLHVDFVSRNAVFQEQSMGIRYNQETLSCSTMVNKDDFRFH